MSTVESVYITLEEIGRELRPCPFCGSTELELANTWTPSYWVECNCCGATKPGQAANWKTNDQAYDRSRHVKAAISAVDAWNSRFSA